MIQGRGFLQSDGLSEGSERVEALGVLPSVTGFIVTNDGAWLIGSGPNAEAASASVGDELARALQPRVPPTAARPVEETEWTGPHGPAWQTFEFNGCEATCLEEEIDEVEEKNTDANNCDDVRRHRHPSGAIDHGLAAAGVNGLQIPASADRRRKAILEPLEQGHPSTWAVTLPTVRSSGVDPAETHHTACDGRFRTWGLPRPARRA